LANSLEHQLKTVHVAFRQVAAAGVERQPPGRRGQVFDRQEVIGFLWLEESVRRGLF
jgi:hypothetical protein